MPIPETKSANLYEFVQQIVAQNIQFTEAANIDVCTPPKSIADAYVDIDLELMRRVFINLIRNGIEAAQNANINLKEAITRNDAEATTHHQKLLDLAVEKTEGAAARMKQCGTGVLSVTGETQSTTKRDCKVEPCLGGEEVYAPDAIEKQSLTGADKIDASNNVDASPYM